MAGGGNTVKEMTKSFGKLDKFQGQDFRRWQKKMHFMLTTLKVVHVLSTPIPEIEEDDTVENLRRRSKWENDDYICKGHILNGMSDPLFDIYQNVESAKELWDCLEAKYMAEDSSSKKFLVTDFNNYKMVESRSVMEQFNELLRILGQFTQHGLKMDETISVSSIIDKLPPSWKDFKHNLKHGKDELSLIQLGSHLRIEESLRAREDNKGKGKEIAGPSVNMIEEGGKNDNNKNKEKKCAFNNKKGNFGVNKKPKLECWKCGKTGHFKKDCRFGKKHDNANASGSGKGSKDKSENQGQKSICDLNSLIKHSVSLTSEAFYVQDDAIAWWIDSGATTHVCKDRFWFKTFIPVEDGSVLYMGDDHSAPVEGKGNVVLEFSSGKTITLFNVLYVPKLRKNLISGPVLNKLGYKQVCESDKYVLSKSGVFVGFGYYNNGMFMMNLNGVPKDSGSIFMSSSNVINFSLWHARLGHVNYKRMHEMSKDDLIPVFNENNEKCKTCMLTKITRQPFKIITRKSVILELIHSDLCDLHATPSLGHKKAVVRLPDPKRKTLGEKGVACIFVGYAEHSKAYRFYVIEPNDSISINTIIESRDAIFDENCFSSTPRPKDLIPKLDESLKDDHSNEVESETFEPRKSKRARKAKSYGSDFQLYLVEGSKDQIDTQYYYCYSIEEDPRTKFDTSGKGVFICQYVDDMLIFGTDQNQVDKTKNFLSSKFSMKDMGEADVILGIKIKRENKGIVITQSHYIEKILKKFNYENCSPVSTPMDPGEKLMPNTGFVVFDVESSMKLRSDCDTGKGFILYIKSIV
ncbi:unnamed protein product [Trifolium pratense]|uniref:Uncharacterized protein n=1 Tax=Trifolium pratense TaxID=57577 RepID=A0ACB0L8Y3_TRIPR|nr:unnamed protein product [Trifolium pratense]